MAIGVRLDLGRMRGLRFDMGPTIRAVGSGPEQMIGDKRPLAPDSTGQHGGDEGRSPAPAAEDRGDHQARDSPMAR